MEMTSTPKCESMMTYNGREEGIGHQGSAPEPSFTSLFSTNDSVLLHYSSTVSESSSETHVPEQKRLSTHQSDSTMPKRWKSQHITMVGENANDLRCCLRLRCYENCSLDVLKGKQTDLFNASRASRLGKLVSMLASDGKFHFEGCQVCNKFLFSVIRFSKDLQNSLLRPFNLSQDSGILAEQEIDVHSLNHPSSVTLHSKLDILSFLMRSSEICSEHMPHRKEIHLPYFRKTHVYESFLREYKVLHNEDPPTISYFLWVWKKFCPSIKVRRARRFSRCALCDELSTFIRQALDSHRYATDLLDRKAAHIEMVMRERLFYRMKQDKAKLYGSQYCSIIVHGADQSAFGLPNFVTSTKDTRGRSFKVRLIGVLEQLNPNKLHLFTMTEEHKTGANHTVETIHRFIMERKCNGSLPSTLFMEMDNCTRGNKNKYLFAYIESLIARNVCKTIEVSFLPIGHTHEDIDQAFSRTSERLRSNDALTLLDLHQELRTTYGGHARVIHLKSIINWSGLCDMERLLKYSPHFSQNCFFSFLQNSTDTALAGLSDVISDVKASLEKDWKPLHGSKFASGLGFLKRIPNLQNTPALTMCEPPGKDEVTKRLQSEEGRTNDPEKLKGLYNVRDHVFRGRTEVVHWDFSTTPEMLYCNGRGHQLSLTGEVIDDSGQHFDIADGNAVTEDIQNGMPINNYRYDVNSFVIVRAVDKGWSVDFWIGKVVLASPNNYRIVTSLLLHWYGAYGNSAASDTKYGPLHQHGKKGKH